MKFYADWRTYNTRYGSGLIAFLSMCTWMFLYPIVFGKELMFDEIFKRFFLSDIKLAGLLLGIITFCQIIGYLQTYRDTRFFTIKDSCITFNLFNGKIIELEYLKIESVTLVKNVYFGMVFEFILKSGERKFVKATVKNKQQAFDLINKKIEESKSKQIKNV